MYKGGRQPDSRGDGMGRDFAMGAAMKSTSVSFHALGKALSFFFVLLVGTVFIFFLIGFIFYKPPKIQQPHDSMTMPIERDSQEVSPTHTDKERAREAKEDEQLALAAKLLPLLRVKPGKVKVATRYEGLLAQMDSVLDGMGPVQAPDLVEDLWEKFMNRNENDATAEGIAAGVPLDVTIRERMVMIKEALEYASSQAGISVDLLAAVAWAETTMFPYAINVKGKTYIVTSRKT